MRHAQEPGKLVHASRLAKKSCDRCRLKRRGPKPPRRFTSGASRDVPAPVGMKERCRVEAVGAVVVRPPPATSPWVAHPAHLLDVRGLSAWVSPFGNAEADWGIVATAPSASRPIRANLSFMGCSCFRGLKNRDQCRKFPDFEDLILMNRRLDPHQRSRHIRFSAIAFKIGGAVLHRPGDGSPPRHGGLSCRPLLTQSMAEAASSAARAR